MKSLKTLGLTAALMMSAAGLANAQTALEGGEEVNMVLLPKFLGILVFVPCLGSVVEVSQGINNNSP